MSLVFEAPKMQQSLLHTEDEEHVVCACCTGSRLKWGGFCSLYLALALLLVSLYVPAVIQTALDNGVHDFVSLAPEAYEKQSEGFRVWADWTDEDAVPIYQSFYFFNITNTHEILAAPTTKPIVTQHGPYVYREIKKKLDFQYGTDYDNRQTLQFKEWIYWEFDPTQSDPSLNPDLDKYVTINVPFQAVTNAFESLFALPFTWSAFNASCYDSYPDDWHKLFMSDRTVTEVLFGFESCITIAANLTASGVTPARTFPGLLGTNLPPSNVTNEYTIGNLTKPDMIYTGDDDPDFARQYVQWKGEDYLTVSLGPVTESIWGSTHANRVLGTDGSQFKQHVKENQTLTAWVDDVMRGVPLVNVDAEHVNDLHGIDLLRFRMDPKLLLNATQVPVNSDYYAFGHNGLLNVSRSKQNLPIYMSKPHFLDADQELVDDIVGMAPDRDTHDTALDVEPLTGATMRANKRLQVNIRTSPFSVDFLVPTWYPNIGVHYIPVVWIDERGEITSSKASDFKAAVYGAKDAMKYIKLLGAIIGSIFVGIATMLFFISISRSSKEARLGGTPPAGINNRY